MLDRTQAPPFQKSSVLTLLNPQRFTAANGTSLYVLHGGTQEVIRLELMAKAGKWYETSAGIAHFAAAQLDKGTIAKSSFQIASYFDALGAHVEITAGNDFITITIYALTKNLAEVLAVVNEILYEATFPEEELLLAKNIALQNLKVNEEKTSFLAGKYFRKAIFGDHPYGSELDSAGIEKIESKKLQAFQQSFLLNFQAIAAGHITETTLRVLTNFLEALPIGSANQKELDFAKPLPVNQYVTKEGSVQSTIRMGKRIINRHHKDFFELLFVTHLLGGYFGSRLMKNIREEKGLTYGIYSSVHPLVRDAYFIIGADVNRENRELTVAEIHKELNLLKTQAIKAEELETSRNHFIGSLQAEVTTPFAHADKFKTILLNNLPEDYYQQMIDRVSAMKSDDIQRIATLYFSTESFSEIAVG